MKKSLLIISISLAIASAAAAQMRFGLNPGVGLAMPMGDFGDAFGSGISVIAQFELEPTQSLAVTLQGGWQRWGAERSSLIKVYNVPIMGGIKYYLAPGGTRPYLMGKIGHCIWGEEYTGYSESDMGLAFGGGAEISISPVVALDLAGSYYSVQTEGEASNFFELRSGIKFNFSVAK
jgi:hypothetical protein